MAKQITQKDIIRFENLAKRLAKFIADVQKRVPEANLYLQEDTLHLMSGPSHGTDGRPLFGNSVAEVLVPGAGGGAW